MAILTQRHLWWGLANALGIAAFLAFAAQAWIEPELANESGASAGNFILWGVSALPILVIFLLAHLIVAGWALAQKRRERMWVLALTATCWIVVAMFDNAHHGI